MEQFNAGGTMPVRVDRIERALGQLWRAAGEPAQREEQRSSVTRAAAWNLLVPCTEEGESAARAAVVEVVAAHPARVLLLVTRPAAVAAGMTASVTALCRRLRGQGGALAGRQVCCELIALRAGGDEARHLADAARALLVPDLPVAVWWPGDAPGPEEEDGFLAASLAPLADRWILDTDAGGAGAALHRAAALQRVAPGRVSDLAWIRLLPWRELTAQFFDPRAFRERLTRLDRLEVWVAPGGRPPSEALLWLGWVADRLRWELEAAESEGRWRFRRPGGTAAALLRREFPVPSSEFQVSSWQHPEPETRNPAPPSERELLAVRLSAGEAEAIGRPPGPLPPEIAFTITREPGSDCATLVVTTEGACPLPRVVRLPRPPHGSPSASSPLAAALSEPRKDPIYPGALSIAARL